MLSDINELLEADNNLIITAANGEDMPYTAWVEVLFRLTTDRASETEVLVPTLVMEVAGLARPIIGSNVIGLIVESGPTHQDRQKLIQAIDPAFPGFKTNSVRACAE